MQLPFSWPKPSHFILSQRCNFGLSTAVPGYIISSVGDLHINHRREMIGSNGYYETMVFSWDGKLCTEPSCNCGRPRISQWDELACRRAMTEEECRANHAALVAQYSAMTPPSGIVSPAVSSNPLTSDKETHPSTHPASCSCFTCTQRAFPL